ncbi:ABC transporter substrate-binding protein [Microbacterium sp. Leaf179]|uniref:ABC transporter substrate-binding protein n=1 Tax=Microbacterium sp. Leaf179 TaxID=1736288 RepID=UPI0006FA4466|nr:ABC transporter substrate-binding protein [Microbacterium sp. Leaf179]KQR86558.1 hypothetical protein ASF96_09375 [Microbacterium sp. Leaf179]
MTHPVRRTPLAASLLGVVLLATAGCAGTAPADAAPAGSTGAHYPVTVSSCGADSTYQKAPERVLLGAPGIIDTLDALGVGDRAIGYTLSDLDTGEAAARPKLTQNSADWTPSKEYLAGAAPDLFIANDEQQFTGNGAATVDDLRTLGAGLYVLGRYCVGASAAPSIDAVYDDITALGTVFGVPEKADELTAQLRGRVTDAAALRGDRKLSAASVSVVDGTVYALTGAGYQAVLDALGITNVFADAGANYTQISREDVITANPDVIFVDYSGPAQEADALNAAKTLFAGSAAVADGRVFGQNENSFQAGGVRIVDVIEQSAKDAFTG